MNTMPLESCYVCGRYITKYSVTIVNGELRFYCEDGGCDISE